MSIKYDLIVHEPAFTDKAREFFARELTMSDNLEVTIELSVEDTSFSHEFGVEKGEAVNFDRIMVQGREWQETVEQLMQPVALQHLYIGIGTYLRKLKERKGEEGLDD